MQRIILHCDANSFYASCELVYQPSLRGLAMAVCGSREERHGIVLAATPEAKRRGVKTAMVNWEALQLCPELIVLPPEYGRYIEFSRRLRAIYSDYTDRVEAFGLDENWLDVTAPDMTWDKAVKLSVTLRQRVWDELGLTISVGISWNKVFAKLGSDMKKPDATTLIRPEDLERLVYPCPAEDMLGVGRRMGQKLRARDIKTIGDLAQCDPAFMGHWLGKIGIILQAYAAGQDTSPVMAQDESAAVKSVGNSVTPPRDLNDLRDVNCLMHVLAESVGARLREINMRGRCINLFVRDSALNCFGAQKTVDYFTTQTEDLVRTGHEIFNTKGFEQHFPLRSMGLAVSSLTGEEKPQQLDLFGQTVRRDRQQELSRAVDDIRRRFGQRVIERAVVLSDEVLSAICPKTEHVIHPVGFMNNG